MVDDPAAKDCKDGGEKMVAKKKGKKGKKEKK